MGNTGANGDLKEQAHRHRRAHRTAKTPSAAFELLPLQPQQQRQRRRPGETRSCFSKHGSSRSLPSRAAPLPSPPHLPPPGTVPGTQQAPWAAGCVPETQSFLLGARKAIGTACGWDAGLCAMPYPEQDLCPKLGIFHGEQRLCAKPSRQQKLVRGLPSSSTSKLIWLTYI